MNFGKNKKTSICDDFHSLKTNWRKKNTQLIQNVHSEISRDFLIRYGQIVDKLNSQNDEIKLKMMFVWVRKKNRMPCCGKKILVNQIINV